MEFPETGKYCSMKGCQLLDFLPFICKHCQATFCKEHFHTILHKCPKTKNLEPNLEKPLNFLCSKESCKEVSLIQMSCIKCKQHFCLTHRYHECFESLNKMEETKKLKKWQIPKKQFAEAKALVDQQITDNLNKSKNTAMANKVQLMRVKGSAIGSKNIPMTERCYFHVYLPLTIKNKHIGTSKGIFVNMQWTIGKCIDSMADILKVPNNNNTTPMNKLQLYHHSNGALICNEMDISLAKLFENSTIVDGQRVVLEYSDNVPIETSLYK
ncbi:AN1-type zinc finger protein 1 [Harpegnathos saltator]|uniref:AN1-type zinc finger protein 1 n=1 Tax=Harpegnathos saltator TaxID=610380 RepID=E2BKZ2_HARSA|nr:AN1-type zinc finger protein 1 [Harpegnathos saltator]EFN83646.1 AN1-type zinc finger protein 1 [Harpegnathos saltator]